MRKTFGSKPEEMTAERRKLHNEELHDLYCSPNVIRVMQRRKKEMCGACGKT
jgi:hypothetical protein